MTIDQLLLATSYNFVPEHYSLYILRQSSIIAQKKCCERPRPRRQVYLVFQPPLTGARWNTRAFISALLMSSRCNTLSFSLALLLSLSHSAGFLSIQSCCGGLSQLRHVGFIKGHLSNLDEWLRSYIILSCQSIFIPKELSVWSSVRVLNTKMYSGSVVGLSSSYCDSLGLAFTTFKFLFFHCCLECQWNQIKSSCVCQMLRKQQV